MSPSSCADASTTRIIFTFLSMDSRFFMAGLCYLLTFFPTLSLPCSPAALLSLSLSLQDLDTCDLLCLKCLHPRSLLASLQNSFRGPLKCPFFRKAFLIFPCRIISILLILYTLKLLYSSACFIFVYCTSLSLEYKPHEDRINTLSFLLVNSQCREIRGSPPGAHN